jgi:hypothetical protein
MENVSLRTKIETWWSGLGDKKRMSLLAEYGVPVLSYKYIKEIYQCEVIDREIV